MLTVTPITAFQDNYIWALHDECHAVLVDPGDSSPCIEFLVKNGLNLLAILVTHHHSDHVGGNRDLAARYHPPIYGPAHEPIPGLTNPVSGGDKIAIPELGLHFSVVDTPGHTLGHISFFGDNRLFCGDTLFACGCGRLFEGTPAMMASSLNRISELPDSTQIFCAHEYTISNISFAMTVDGANPALLQRERLEQSRRNQGQPTLPSTLALEKATNPFLRCHEPALVHAAETWLKRPALNAVEVFTALRQAKDVF
jgi:hydroxyacylglutathione hydrolase